MIRRLLAGCAGTFFLVFPTGARAQQPAEPARFACAPASEYLVNRYRERVLAPDSTLWATWPAELALPSPNEIVAESDPKRCDRVIRAVFAREGHFGPYRDATVEVVRLGRGYLVRDPTDRAGEWEVVAFLTPDLEVVALWLQ